MKILSMSFTNFLKGLKYIFTPLGILSLFLIIALSITIPQMIASVKTMVDGVAHTFEGTTANWEDVGGHFYALVLNQDWTHPEIVLSNFTDRDYLLTEFQKILGTAFPELPTKIDVVQVLILTCIEEILISFLVIIVLVVIGFIAAFVITNWQVRLDITQRKFWQFIVFMIVDTIIGLLVVYGSFKALESLGKWGLLVVIAILLALPTLSLLEGWIIHGTKRVKLRKVLNFKNVIFLIIGNVLIIGLGVLFTYLINLAGLPVVTIVIALSVFITTQAVTTANAESYVHYVANEKWIKDKIKEEKTAKTNS